MPLVERIKQLLDTKAFSYEGSGVIIITDPGHELTSDLTPTTDGLVIIISGMAEAAITVKHYVYCGSGTLTISGSVSLFATFSYCGSGKIIISGEASLRRTIKSLPACELKKIRGGPLTGYASTCICKRSNRNVEVDIRKKGINCINWRFLTSTCAVRKQFTFGATQAQNNSCNTNTGAFITKKALCRQNLFFFDNEECEKRVVP